MIKRLAFKTFSIVYPRFLGVGIVVFVPLCVFVDTLCGNTDDIDGLLEETWEAMGEGWSLITTGKNAE